MINMESSTTLAIAEIFTGRHDSRIIWLTIYCYPPNILNSHIGGLLSHTQMALQSLPVSEL